MRPFEVEVFDRNFNFRSSSLIDADSFSYSLDMLTKANNVVTLSATDLSIREDPSSGSAGDGTIGLSDYIRITTDKTNVDGVITKLEKEDNKLTVTYSDLMSLFNHEVFTDPLEITNSTIENYIAKLLTLSFISNSDTSQNIPGLTISVRSATVGIFDFVDVSKKMVVLNILNDLIYPAFKKYLVGVYISFDIENKQLVVNVGRRASTIMRTIELDLPNVIDKNVLIRGTSSETNKLTIIEDDEENDFPKHNYYLHTDYTYDTDGSINRMLPVINDMELVNIDTLAETGYWTANAGVLYATDLLELDRALTNGEKADITSGMSLVASYIYAARGSGKENLDYRQTTIGRTTAYYYLSESLVFYIINNMPGVYHWLSGETPDNNIYDDLQNAGEGYFWYVAEVLSGSGNRRNHVYTNKGEDSIHYEITIDGTIPTTPGDHRSDPIDCYNWTKHASHDIIFQDIKVTLYVNINGNNNIPSIYELHLVASMKVSREEYETSIDDYKKSNTYKSDVAAYKAAHLSDILSDYAGSVFGTSKYKNLIELTVRQDDDLIYPMSIPFGGHLDIIHKGTSYHSVLTAGTLLQNGLIKLTFGMIRLELTKILNMKGV